MSVSWLKKGDDSAKLAEQEKAAAEKRKAEQGKAFRFFMKKGEEAPLLFCDGDLHPTKGYLIPPRWYEHTVYFQGSWVNILCPQQTNPEAGEKCPICEGKDKPALVSAFTVIDLREVESKKNPGTKYAFTRKLFVCKPTTFELLNKLAVKRGGLKGCRFDVSRTGEKSASVGDVFDFQEKFTDYKALEAKYTVSFKSKGKDGKEEMKTQTLFAALDYEKEILYRSADELRGMGFGAPSMTGGGQTPEPQEVGETPTGKSFEDEL